MIPLLCPVCKGELSPSGSSYVCGKRHCFDVAKEGYINLAIGKSDSGDDPAMCRARHEFLNAGYYLPFAEAIAEELELLRVKSICDAGCGEGHYSRVIKSRIPSCDAVGFDLAKTSIRLGAKAEKGKSDPIRYAVAGIFDMPLPDGRVDCVLSVFAPVPDLEASRILTEGGHLAVAHPGKDHLSGLKGVLYDTPYDNEEKRPIFDGFTFVRDRRVKYKAKIIKPHIESLFLMTPYYWKTSRADAEKLITLTKLETELDFIISIYKKN